MADFKTHITVSTTLGVGYAAVAYRHFDVPLPTCALAGALCSVSGMLPDLDSDSGVPLRESLAFAAACVPVMILPRFEQLGWPTESIVLACALIYMAVRFGVGTALKKYTVHRGMFHSIPAALIAGECAFLLCVNGDIYLRAYKAAAVLAGFFSHLILDEIYSVKVQGGRIGLKSSSGTAMKLWGDSAWANLSAYGKLAGLGVLVLNDPIWTTVSPQGAQLHSAAATIVKEFEKRAGDIPIPPQLQPLVTGTAGARPTTPSTAPNQPPSNLPPQYTAPQYAAPQYATPQLPTQPYAQPQYAQPQYSQPQYAPPNYAPQYAGPQYAPPSPAPSGYPSGYSSPAAPQYAPPNYGAPNYAPQYQQPSWPQQPATLPPYDPRVLGPMTQRY